MTAKYTVANAIGDIFNCATAQSVIDCFRKFVLPYHIDTFASGEIDLDNRKRSIFHCVEWPERWRNFYFQSGMLEHDPVVGALDKQRGAVTWMELRNRNGLNVAGTDALIRIAAEGWNDGLVVPLHRNARHYGLISLVALNHVISEQEKIDLTAVSLIFQDRLRQLVPGQGFPVPPAGLTPRELECIKLIAQGYSDSRAGEALRISPSTVHEHAERAKRKLDARNRAELVALAIAFGIILL